MQKLEKKATFDKGTATAAARVPIPTHCSTAEEAADRRAGIMQVRAKENPQLGARGKGQPIHLDAVEHSRPMIDNAAARRDM